MYMSMEWCMSLECSYDVRMNLIKVLYQNSTMEAAMVYQPPILATSRMRFEEAGVILSHLCKSIISGGWAPASTIGRFVEAQL